MGSGKKGVNMPSPEQIIIARKSFPDSEYSFCLERVIRHDKNDEIEFTFCWRQPNNSVIKEPAYFNWEWIGELFRQAIANGNLQVSDLEPLLRGLMALPTD
jgi:hypothetical protein